MTALLRNMIIKAKAEGVSLELFIESCERRYPNVDVEEIKKLWGE